jgi:tetratricopeptide (TPR) repeat protein
MIKTLCMLCVLTMLCGCLGGTAARQSPSKQRLTDLQQRAQTSAEKGLHADAARLLQEALRLASALDDHQGQASILLQQARLARRNGELSAADQAITRGLALAEGSELYADAAQERALLELALGKTEAAVRWAETALREERGALLARRLNLLARLALVQGNTDQAGQLAEQALTKASSDALAAERANALRMLGIVRGNQKRYAEGEQLLQQALTLDKELELPARIAADLEALAGLAGQRGDAKAHLQFLQRAKTVREASGQRE